MPTQEEARRIWTDRHVVELREGMSASIFEGFIPLAQEIKNRPDGDHLMAFALKYFFTHHRMEKVQDLNKAVHKKEEHERKELRVAPRREVRSEPSAAPRGEPRAASRDRGGRDSRERTGRPDRGERGVVAERRPRSDREIFEAREGATAAPPRVEPVEIPATREPEPSEGPAERGRPSGSRVFLNAGEADGADEARIRETVASFAPGVEVVKVELRRSHTFLEVKPDDLEGLVNALQGKEGFGKALAAEKARRRRR
jgi:ATP-dependent RNA helicase DeaD